MARLGEAGAVQFSKARKGSVLYDDLRRQIVKGALKPGETMLEITVAREYGCSQGTVREALMRLQEDGLVVRSGYRGTTVSVTGPTEAREMQFLRLHLETQGIRRAALLADDSLLARLSRVVDEMERVAEAGDEYALTELDCEFHLAIFARAGMPALDAILSRCLLHLHRLTLAEPGRTRPLLISARRHWDVVEALRTRDPETAVTAITHHINTVLETGLAGEEG
ncbi:GntR family transcriptional regulator [Skermanella mucosa]|uniref:GntR family transcriptional regulator n=1 Tax=Skermanella mucosa TaxID=1789672 RepID=UPI00192B3AB2|nr:GntR family transcriptional regulator [Skermanella mucosa]UEM23784.1 GntR family transcriptional regulator [Skermanella mucosa]